MPVAASLNFSPPESHVDQSERFTGLPGLSVNFVPF
jgi:hypothetical protein